MLARALVIAIENYPHSAGELANEIKGAGQAGQDFAAWFVANKLDPALQGELQPNILFVCSDTGDWPANVQHFGVDRKEILNAVQALIAAGQDQTEELYVFFSGHGFTFQDSRDKPAVAELVAADFVSTAESGDACLDLTELQRKLWAYLGGKHHYYFIDACRNILNEEDIEPVAFGRKFGRAAQRGQPTRYTLYSTRLGKTADIESPFPGALVEGLKGKGRAKGYTPDHQLFVMFALLKHYTESRMGNQKVDGAKEGSGDGYILQIQPIPNYTCKVVVEAASAVDRFRLRKAPVGQPDFAQELTFTGPAFNFSYQPGDIVIDVLDENGTPLERVDPGAGQPLDFFDECSARFRRAPAPLLSATGGVSAFEPVPFEVRAINLHTAESVEFPAGAPIDLGAGIWEIAQVDRGSAISKQTIQVSPKAPSDLPGTDLLGGPAPPAQEAPSQLEIPSHLDDPARTRIPQLLGNPAISNPDLGLWLSLIGAASLIVPGQYENFKNVGLASFSGVAPGASAIFVLSGLRQYGRIALRSGERWSLFHNVRELEGVAQLALPARPGAQLLSLQVDQEPVRTFVSWALPDRVTLIVLSASVTGKLAVWQFILPVAHLVGGLPAITRTYLGYEMALAGNQSVDLGPILSTVRTMFDFQNVFSANRTIAPPDPDEKERWNEILYAKWLDPVTSLIVCYDIIRRGTEDLRSVARDIVLPNLRTYYRGIPDIESISERLVPGSGTQPSQPPLFTEGLFAFPDWPENLPYPAARLDYGALWTTWKGVVEAAP